MPAENICTVRFYDRNKDRGGGVLYRTVCEKNRPIYNYVRVMQKQADAAVRKVIQYTVDPESFETENIP